MREALIFRLDNVKKFDSANLMPHGLGHDGVLTRLKRIEAILRNGLPHNDKDVAGTIAHSHAEVELLLESIDEDRWMQ